jgi:hypothetical protein
VTWKYWPGLAEPLTVTTTLPLPAPLGTVATIVSLLQLVGVATIPLKATMLAPCVAPKFVPVIAPDAPVGPEAGDRPTMYGADAAGVAVKLTAA